MKNLNVNACCYRNVSTQDNQVISYDQPFTGLKVSQKSDNCKFTTGSFAVVTQINMMGTNQEAHKVENPVEQRKSLDFIIRITKRDKNPEKQIGIDLDSFTIDLSQSSIEHACYPFFNYTRVTRVQDLELVGGTGFYIIKVLVKESDKEKWIIQSMNLVQMIAAN